MIVSASLSLEEGKAVLALFREGLGAKVMLHTGKPGWADNILRQSDRNANTKGLRDLGYRTRRQRLDDSTLLVLFETLGSDPLPEGIPAPAIVVSPSVTPAVKAAKVALPAASYAESSGTVVNFMGVSQSYAPVLKPKGLALSHTETIKKLASVAGQKPDK